MLPRLKRFADVLVGEKREGKALLRRALQLMLTEHHRYQRGTPLDRFAFTEICPHDFHTSMRLFGLVIRRATRGKAPEEAEGTEVRFARLEEEVRHVKELARRLEGIAARVEANELAREAGFLKATEALRSVLGRIDARRQSEQSNRSRRPADDDGDGDGDSGDNWLRGYHALRGHAPRAPAFGAEDEDVTEDGE